MPVKSEKYIFNEVSMLSALDLSISKLGESELLLSCLVLIGSRRIMTAAFQTTYHLNAALSLLVFTCLVDESELLFSCEFPGHSRSGWLIEVLQWSIIRAGLNNMLIVKKFRSVLSYTFV